MFILSTMRASNAPVIASVMQTTILPIALLLTVATWLQTAAIMTVTDSATRTVIAVTAAVIPVPMPPLMSLNATGLVTETSTVTQPLVTTPLVLHLGCPGLTIALTRMTVDPHIASVSLFTSPRPMLRLQLHRRGTRRFVLAAISRGTTPPPAFPDIIRMAGFCRNFLKTSTLPTRRVT